MKNIENLIEEYNKDKTDSSFSEIYRIVVSKIIGERNIDIYFYNISNQLKVDVQEVISEFGNTILYAVEKYDGSIDFIKEPGKPCYFKWLWKNRRANIYKKAKRTRLYETYSGVTSDNELDDYVIRIPDELNIEEHVIAKRKADQLALIDYLLIGADDATTAIVNSFLSHPKPTATAIAKELGCHHSKVIRALTRLAAKYDSKQYGDYTDYLVAL
ncbi:hypothetical protein MHI57_24780 [Cytobacillus sp. FSL K6-0129]|uniref:hypothetical protein n=1 Tax=Cytobacillus sp. FSL K6-0129 TaxID=2921421 RepID=UPI0030F6DC40